MNTINPLSSSTNVGSSTARSSGQSPGQRNFQSGDIFKATIVEAKGNDLFTLEIGGNQIAAQSKALLSPGQILQLQVTSTSPQVELKIISNTSHQFLGRSLTLIGKNINLADLAKSLQQTQNPAKSMDENATVLETKGNDVFILDIGGKQIPAQSSSPLTPGEILQLQAANPQPKLEFQIVAGDIPDTAASSIPDTAAPPLPDTATVPMPDTSTAATPETAAAPTPAPPEGTTITLVGNDAGLADLAQSLTQNGTGQATVLEAKGHDVFLLDIGGKQVVTQSTAELVPGQTLTLQEPAVLPQQTMEITAGSRNHTDNVLLTLMTNTADLTDTGLNSLISAQQQSLTSFSDSLSPVSQGTLEHYFALEQNMLSGKNGGEILKQLVNRMGMTMENLLAAGNTDKASATLKAALLETADTFKDAQQVAKTTHQLINTLQTYQLAQLHLENPANFIFPLPLPFLEKGYLMIEDYGQQQGDKEGADASSPMRFSLHLTMEELGNLRIDFLQYPNGLYIRFNTDSKDKSDFVESFSDTLKQAISNVAVLGLSFSENATDPAAELLKRIIPQGSSMLDTTA